MDTGVMNWVVSHCDPISNRAPTFRGELVKVVDRREELTYLGHL